MDNLRPRHVVLSDAKAGADDTHISIPKDDEHKLYRSAISFLVTAGKAEPHTSSSFQLYSIVVALVPLLLGPPSADSALAEASYFLFG